MNSVPLDETSNRIFGDEIPDWRQCAPWITVATDVQRNAGELAERRNEPAVRHAQLRTLQQRRSSPPENADPVVTQFDFLPVDVGFDTLLVRGELLITRECYEGGPPGARQYLDALHMTATEVAPDALEGRVLRLTPATPLTAQELSDVASVLRRRGCAASLTYVTPAACGQGDGVVKSCPGTVPGGPGQNAAELQARWSGRGRRPRVAVIDTGVDRKVRQDGWLTGVPRRPGDNIDPLDAFPLPGGDGYLDFEAGHGTFVAGVVQQVAPGADITVYRAIDSDGIGSEVTVAVEMIRAVKQDGAQIINLSLGCQTVDDVPPIAMLTALEIIREWERETGNEVLVVAAAGNYADTRPCWPAALPGVVSVAGLGPDLLPAAWSSRGFWVTCSAIGQGILSTYVEGREPPVVYPEPLSFGPDAWAVWTGTSFAAPQIAAGVARLYQSEGIGLREALRRLLATGRQVPQFGRAVPILYGI